MENECEALPGVAHPGVRDNRSTLNTKTGYDDDDEPELKVGIKKYRYGPIPLPLPFYPAPPN